MDRAPVVLGTLSIIFGAFTAVLMGLAAVAGVSSSDVSAAQERYQRLSVMAFATLASALVVVGVGLVRRARWSRVAGIVWALAAIAVVELEYYALGQIGPRTAGMYGMLVAETLYPALMLLVLARAR